MPEMIEAVFENGVFRPLKPVSLAEKTVVQISIASSRQSGPRLLDILKQSYDLGVKGDLRREEIYEDRG